MAYSASQISDWMLSWADVAEGEDAGLTHLKLQKLLYYAQGTFLAARNEPLFADRIEAWTHGPVVPTEYHRLKGYGSGPIVVESAISPEFDWNDFDDVEDHLIDVWNRYGQFAAWTLREKTHHEPPWLDASARGAGAEITQESMRAYFSTL